MTKKSPPKTLLQIIFAVGSLFLLSFVGNSRNEEFKGSVPTMEPLIDLPMLDILRFKTRPLSTKTVKPRDTHLLEMFGVHLDARGH